MHDLKVGKVIYNSEPEQDYHSIRVKIFNLGNVSLLEDVTRQDT